MVTDMYSKVANAMVLAQSQLIGPVAWDLVLSTGKLSRDQLGNLVIVGDPISALKSIIRFFELAFGADASEFCRNAARSAVPEASSETLTMIFGKSN